MIVLDASVAVTWLLNEPSPVVGLDELLVSGKFIVPAHWPIEVGHAILKALRRKQISNEQFNIIGEELVRLDLTVARPKEMSGIIPLVNFGRDHGLTMYDAGYVDLAIERNAALVTLDLAMRATAEKLGVELAL